MLQKVYFNSMTFASQDAGLRYWKQGDGKSHKHEQAGFSVDRGHVKATSVTANLCFGGSKAWMT